MCNLRGITRTMFRISTERKKRADVIHLHIQSTSTPVDLHPHPDHHPSPPNTHHKKTFDPNLHLLRRRSLWIKTHHSNQCLSNSLSNLTKPQLSMPISMQRVARQMDTGLFPAYVTWVDEEGVRDISVPLDAVWTVKYGCGEST